MTEPQRYSVLMRTLAYVDPSEVGEQSDRTPSPWETRMHATCECLSWRGALDNLERRQREDDLGEGIFAEFPTHTHPALVVAQSLLDQGVINPDELQARMEAVRARLEQR